MIAAACLQTTLAVARLKRIISLYFLPGTCHSVILLCSSVHMFAVALPTRYELPDWGALSASCPVIAPGPAQGRHTVGSQSMRSLGDRGSLALDGRDHVLFSLGFLLAHQGLRDWTAPGP